MKFLKFLLTFSVLQLLILSQSALEKVKELDLQTYEGSFTTYFSEGYNEKANDVSGLLNNSTAYFENNFDIKKTFALAVLSEKDWSKVTQIPYGLPFVSGPPYIVCIPGNSENKLGSVVKNALNNSNLMKKYSLKSSELTEQFISLIGFHELGHIYATELGINFPNKWTYEFAATYFAYLYLKETAPTKNMLWLDVADLLLDEIEPKYKSLKTFEELYVRVGIENYAWYQVVFLVSGQSSIIYFK